MTAPTLVTDKSYRRPRLWRHPRMIWSRLLRNWPFFVWILVVLGIVAIYRHGAHMGSVAGAVESVIDPVAPLETARLVSVPVVIGQSVKAGAIVAQMDTMNIDAEIAVNKALLAQAQSTLARDQQNLLQLVGRVEVGILQAKTALQTEQARQASQQAELAELKKEQARRDGLFAKKLIDEVVVSQLRPQIAALEGAVAAGPAILATYEQHLATAQKGLTDLREWMRVQEGEGVSDSLSTMTQANAAVIGATLEHLEARKRSHALRAMRDGVVSQILFWPGTVVNSGTAIIQIVAEHPQRVIGFLPEVHSQDFPMGQRTLVWRMTGRWPNRGGKVPAEVVSISPDVEALPPGVSPYPTQPVRGRRLVLQLLGAHDFIPGEAVEISQPPMPWADLIAGFTGRAGPQRPVATNAPAQATDKSGPGTEAPAPAAAEVSGAAETSGKGAGPQ
jgi:multidrug resistance efflux pump